MSTTPPPSNTYTLCIGVNDYPQLGPGASLPGPRNDVRQWLRFAQTGLGVPRELCHVLVQEAEGDDPIRTRAASGHAPTLDNAHQALLKMMQWLKDQGDTPSTALVVFSGHGANLAHRTTEQGTGLALAFADARFEEGTLHGVLPLAQLEHILHENGLANRVTVVVDACYTALSATAFGSHPGFATLEPSSGPLNSRLLLGSGEFAPAYGMHFEGHDRGVFSVCLLQALSLWQVGSAGGVTVIRGAYQDILYRARLLMTAMGFDDQQPVYAGSPLGAVVPFNQPHRPVSSGSMSVVPDGARWKKEVGPDIDTAPGFWLVNADGAALFALVFGGPEGLVVDLDGNGTQRTVQPNQLGLFRTKYGLRKLAEASGFTLTWTDVDPGGTPFVPQVAAPWNLKANDLQTHATWSPSSSFPSPPQAPQGHQMLPFWLAVPDAEVKDSQGSGVAESGVFLYIVLDHDINADSYTLVTYQWQVTAPLTPSTVLLPNQEKTLQYQATAPLPPVDGSCYTAPPDFSQS